MLLSSWTLTVAAFVIAKDTTTTVAILVNAGTTSLRPILVKNTKMVVPNITEEFVQNACLISN